MSLLEEAESIAPYVVDLRRQLHRNPEIGLLLPKTQAVVRAALDEAAIDYSVGKSLSSVTAVIHGTGPGPDTILRADMDALPLQELSGVSFTSEVDGAMHACGHDTHVAMLLGAARLLVARRDQFTGRVLLMFQPGEEGYSGGRLMLEEGLLDDVDRSNARAFALHATAAFASGTVHTRTGPLLAATDSFEIVINGRGGHASEPHRTLDPIPVASEIVMALQAMMTRRVNVFDPAVLSVTRLEAGTTHNIVPEHALLTGTIRTLSEETRQHVQRQLRTVVTGVSSSHLVTGEVNIDPGYPATVNDPEVTERSRAAAHSIVGPARVHEMPSPRMGGEDFSYLLEQVPGAMVFLGARPAEVDPATAPMNHSNRVVFDESVLATGVALHVAFVMSANAATN